MDLLQLFWTYLLPGLSKVQVSKVAFLLAFAASPDFRFRRITSSGDFCMWCYFSNLTRSPDSCIQFLLWEESGVSELFAPFFSPWNDHLLLRYPSNYEQNTKLIVIIHASPVVSLDERTVWKSSRRVYAFQLPLGREEFRTGNFCRTKKHGRWNVMVC